jgi:PIN domain nuclease of toxin-antitoxin system
MKTLLDTQILLWSLREPDRIPKRICAELADRSREVFFSAASIWEIGIKASLGRSDFQVKPADVWRLAILAGFAELTVTSAHGAAVADLPWHHRDPFDRLLIAQALSLPARLLTADPILLRYSELVQEVKAASP